MLAGLFKALLEVLVGFFSDRLSKKESDAAHEAKGAASAAAETNAAAVGTADEMAKIAVRDADREHTRSRLRDGSF